MVVLTWLELQLDLNQNDQVRIKSGQLSRAQVPKPGMSKIILKILRERECKIGHSAKYTISTAYFLARTRPKSRVMQTCAVFPRPIPFRQGNTQWRGVPMGWTRLRNHKHIPKLEGWTALFSLYKMSRASYLHPDKRKCSNTQQHLEVKAHLNANLVALRGQAVSSTDCPMLRQSIIRANQCATRSLFHVLSRYFFTITC